APQLPFGSQEGVRLGRRYGAERLVFPAVTVSAAAGPAHLAAAFPFRLLQGTEELLLELVERGLITSVHDGIARRRPLNLHDRLADFRALLMALGTREVFPGNSDEQGLLLRDGVGKVGRGSGYQTAFQLFYAHKDPGMAPSLQRPGCPQKVPAVRS